MKSYVKKIIEKGFDLQASDLYVFPTEKGYEVSFRMHQEKFSYEFISNEFAEKLILYLKYAGNMDVGEKRRIQIGASTFTRANGEVRHLRLSSVANYKQQETLVIRFLHYLADASSYHVFFPKQFEALQERIQQRGLFLFAGSTGSGKTTTMYTLAGKYAGMQKQVITIEDPVEIEYPNFLQLQTNPKIDVGYDDLIQLCLRHRPDLLIVGEIRDTKTAKAVIRGALTGHTILTTIHGLNKHSIVARLLELGVAKEEVRQCLKGIIYQRILPMKCPMCEGECSRYCGHRKNGVIFDSLFIENGDLLLGEDRGNEDYQRQIGKLWALGYLTTKITKQEINT